MWTFSGDGFLSWWPWAWHEFNMRLCFVRLTPISPRKSIFFFTHVVLTLVLFDQRDMTVSDKIYESCVSVCACDNLRNSRWKKTSENKDAFAVAFLFKSLFLLVFLSTNWNTENMPVSENCTTLWWGTLLGAFWKSFSAVNLHNPTGNKKISYYH